MLLNKKAVKSYCKQNGKSLRDGALHSLELHIIKKLDSCINTWDGGRNFIDARLIEFMLNGIKKGK